MKRFKIIFLVFISVSCSSPLDKSITEDLSLDQLKTEIENDPNFKSSYNAAFVEKIRNNSNLKINLSNTKIVKKHRIKNK